MNDQQIGVKPLPFVITIDGPAGSGKSTVARKLAKRLGFVHLNSGALFRAVALLAKEQGLDLGDDEGMTRLAGAHRFSFELTDSGDTLFLVDGRDLTTEIASGSVGELASKVAVLPRLREVFLQLQRSVAEMNPLVVEGRDSGSIVFPDARFKFYLDASLKERAERRFKELAGSEKTVRLEDYIEDIRRRDERDRSRAVAPHVCPEDAIRIDTGGLSVDEVLGVLYERIAA